MHLELVPSFLDLVKPLSVVMTQPSFTSFCTMLSGWVFAGRRTVTGMIRASQAVGEKNFSSYHRFFAAAKWSLGEMGLGLFAIMLPLLPPLIMLSLDDTLCRKRGTKMYGAGMHHDPLQSSRQAAIVSWGHCWVVLAVVVRFPFCPSRAFSLPVLCRLYLNHKGCARWRVAPRTRPELAVQLLQQLCARYPDREFHLLADSAYGGQSVLGHLPPNCGLTSRLPLDARLHQAPPTMPPGSPGRPRRSGPLLPTPRQLLQQRAHRTSLHIYGCRDRVRLSTQVARWYSVPERDLRIVSVEPLCVGRPIQAIYSTNPMAVPEIVLEQYSQRWSIEEVNRAAKTHLGMEQPQGWSRRAVLRTAPMALLLYSFIVLWFAQVGIHAYHPPYRPWYSSKAAPSFFDMLATLRRQSMLAEVFATPGSPPPPQKILHLIQIATESSS